MPAEVLLEWREELTTLIGRRAHIQRMVRVLRPRAATPLSSCTDALLVAVRGVVNDVGASDLTVMFLTPRPF